MKKVKRVNGVKWVNEWIRVKARGSLGDFCSSMPSASLRGNLRFHIPCSLLDIPLRALKATSRLLHSKV